MTRLTTLLTLYLLTLSGAPAMASDFEQQFVEELKSRRIHFKGDGDGFYTVEVGGRELSINTRNAQAEYDRDGDRESIERFVNNLLTAQFSLPEWPEARAHLFPMIDSSTVDIGDDTISQELTDKSRVVLAYYQSGSGSLRFVSRANLDSWGVTTEEAWRAAREAFGQIVSRMKIEVLTAGELHLGAVHAPEPYKASVLLSSGLKQLIPEEFGWPVLAVAPARDFVYLLRDGDRESIGRVGAVVVREFQQSGYPVSTEVWKISDEGVEAIGEFPVR